MFSVRSAFLLLSTVICSVVLAQTSTQAFVSPPTPGAIGDYSSNPVYSIGQTVKVQWNSDWDYVSLGLYQDTNRWGNFAWINKSNLGNAGTYDWTVQIPTNLILTETPVFYFAVYQYTTTGGSNYFGSHYFNVTGTQSDASTVASSQTTLTTSVSQTITTTNAQGSVVTTTGLAASTVTGVIITQAASTGSSSAQSNPPGGLSDGAKIGIGVGVGLAVLGIAVVFAAFWIVKSRKRTDSVQANKQAAMIEQPKSDAASPYHRPYPQQTTRWNELNGEPARYQTPELASNQSPRG